MFRPTSFGVWSGVAALCGSLGLLPSLSAYAETSQPIIEEIVVTGSLIRRDSFDSPSPLTVVDQDEISANATPNLGEVLVNQTFNYGTDFQTNTFAARPQIGTNSQANLRGLGPRATLNLLDGKRGVGTNLNSALPQIAIGRIDILKDGASATYGTDAVAGVVNVIPRKDFSGAEISAFYQQDDDSDLDEEMYEFIIGSDTENGHFVVSGSYSTRSTLEQVERPEFLREGFQMSATGNPGRWQVPVRDASGAITGAEVIRDPGCGVATGIGPGGTDVGTKGNFLTGDRRSATEFALGLPAGATGARDCSFHFGETWNYINPQEKMSGYVNFQYEFNEYVSNEFDLVVSRLETDSRGSPQNPGGRTEEFPIVLGEHPGNPFRAMTDDGTPLFAQDADGDGIPDRGTDDVNGDGVPDVLVAGTDPASGVPFNEDVDVVALRIFSKIGLMPGANQPTALNADGSNTGNASFDAWSFRARDTLRVRIPDSSWEVEGSLIASRGHVVLEEKNTSQNALEAGLRGQLVAVPESDPRFTGAPQFWNPFATQALECENRVCEHTGTPGFANSVDVLDAVNIQSHQVTDTEFWSADVLGTGELFELPAGMVLAAFGAEYRRDEQEVDASAARNACDWHEGGCAFDWKADQDVWSGFYELAVPAHETLELTLAGRYSDYGGNIGDSFDPKFAALWQPLDILSFRASWGTAFIAPTVEQQFATELCGLETMSDQLTNDTSATFRVACVTGNPNLTPEEADTFNVGVSLNLLDGDLTLGVDYANYDFEDRISQETGNNVLRANFNDFLAAGNDPNSQADIDAWIANNEPDIFRDSTGVVTRVIVDQINAQQMEHTAWDFYATYKLALNNFGNFTFGLNATLADEFTFDLGTGDPQDSGDGVGKQNEQVAEIPPLPEWRINGTVNWFLGNHSARVRVRWIDEFELEFNSAGLQTLHGLRGGDPKVDDITYVDLNYKYTFDDLILGGATTFEVGANNVFDEFPDPFFNLGGIETFVHDVRGRMLYARITQNL